MLQRRAWLSVDNPKTLSYSSRLQRAALRGCSEAS